MRHGTEAGPGAILNAGPMAHIDRTIPHRVARILVVLGVLFIAVAGIARGAQPEVVVLTATGVVDNVLAGYLEEGIAQAAAGGAEAVVVELNTPGGSLDATQRITSTFLEADVPVIVWVAPSGGRAASAGTFITLAAHLAPTWLPGRTSARHRP